MNYLLKIILASVFVSNIACGGGGGGGGSDNSNNGGSSVGQLRRGTDTGIRLMHGVIDATPLTLRTGGQALQSGRFAQETFYLKIGEGELLISAERQNTPSVISAEQVSTIEKGKEYTALITGSTNSGALTLRIIEDTTVRPAEGFTSVRVVNSYQGTPSVSAELSGATFSGVDFGSASSFIDVPSGVGTLIVRNRNGTAILSRDIELLDRGDVSILVTGSNTLGVVFATVYRDLD